MLVSRNRLVEIIRNTKKFYSVQFITRGNGSKRVMNCRNNVHKYVTGAGAAYNAEDHNLINTYSVDSKGYRSIPIEGLIGATVQGVTYLVRD